MTRADLDARVETVTRTMIECRAPGDCSPPHVETVRGIMGEEADGVLFIDPDGRYVQVDPASGVVSSKNPNAYWRAAAGTLEYGRDRSHAEFALPDGGTRTIAWRRRHLRHRHRPRLRREHDRLRDGSRPATEKTLATPRARHAARPPREALEQGR